MPAKSKAQFRLMEAIAHNNAKLEKKVGISRAKAEEFVTGQSPRHLPERVAPKKVMRKSPRPRGPR